MKNKRYAINWRQATPIPIEIEGKIRKIFRNLILTTLAYTKCSCEKRFLRALYCHYVFDDQKAHFEKMIIELKKLGTFVNTETCLDMLKGRKEIDKRYFHLSFDDGFRNIFKNAFPILKKNKIPAIIFIPSSFVGANWEKTKKYCLETTKYNGIIEMIKWKDLDEMISFGYEIGSHTKTHARFSTISSDIVLLEEEILGSKYEIEKKLGKECKYISWPYGDKDDVNELSIKMTKKAGYKACFGAFRGTIFPKRTDEFYIPRHHFEVQWPLSHIKYFAKGGMEVYI